MIRVNVKPEILRWARERAGLSRKDLAGRYPRLEDWEAGAVQPTLKQLEAFARAVRVPAGYLFLSSPPDEPVPIPDFRTVAGRHVTRPSPNLLDTIYACQERQSWYREYARISGQLELGFVNSATLATPVTTVATDIRQQLAFQVAERKKCPTWSDALRLFIRRADDIGVLVMVNGVVASNNHRRLDPAEFRGFAIADPLAPLVFVNGADTKAAQMFTLAHELAHICLGSSALSNIGARPVPVSRREEIWCNAVAAEFLVPLVALRAELSDGEQLPHTMSRLARTFKVSTLVVLRRVLDAEWIDRETFEMHWQIESERLRALNRSSGGGGSFYRTTLARVSRRFARALVESTREGHTLYRDAFRMVGVSKVETFNNLGREAGALD